ncbi:hypothetical protein THAOC_33853 [Thalassiosira oceanica]|uniref:Uncharacterized protein n=1 Tax=Thalassiosira oceanica TaxID=159749 RepID=K0R3G9_THAOC|nr:hypothetical protein THAOC_33853 [Thalassiosira oceanica]|eukprot:EJK47428.1 hypothetical protein THAOC_33853 [Thalassiosira oceanica]
MSAKTSKAAGVGDEGCRATSAKVGRRGAPPAEVGWAGEGGGVGGGTGERGTSGRAADGAAGLRLVQSPPRRRRLWKQKKDTPPAALLPLLRVDLLGGGKKLALSLLVVVAESIPERSGRSGSRRRAEAPLCGPRRTQRGTAKQENGLRSGADNLGSDPIGGRARIGSGSRQCPQTAGTRAVGRVVVSIKPSAWHCGDVRLAAERRRATEPYAVAVDRSIN